MSAIVKACLVANVIKNTGKECDVAMGPTAMLIAVPKSLTFTDTDLSDPVSWLNNLVHATKGSRVFPFFGQNAPIREIANDKENDVVVTLDDGSKVFLRYGFFNRTFSTTSGGICYADSLQSLNKSGYSIIEIDNQGQMLVHQNSDGSYSGLITDFMYSPSPTLPDLKSTPYKNNFQLSYNPTEYVQNGVILEGALPLLATMGLIDSIITKAAAATTTILKIGVETKCAETDLVALFGAALGTHVANFVVFDKTASAAITPSAAAIVSGHIELTGVYPTGHIINVSGAVPSVWLGNLVDGYDAEDGGIDITIP